LLLADGLNIHYIDYESSEVIYMKKYHLLILFYPALLYYE